MKRKHYLRNTLIGFAIILVILAAFWLISYHTGWTTNGWYPFFTEHFPDTDFNWMINPSKIVAEAPDEPGLEDTDTQPASEQSEQPTQPTEPPAPEEPPDQPTEPPELTAPENPETQEAQVITPEDLVILTVTEAPAAHGVYTPGEDITVKVNGELVALKTFTYSGGYIPADDPWFSEEKENENSYGPAISGETPQELADNWLKAVCLSPWPIIHLRTQLDIISPKSLEEENQLALELAAKPASEYDAVANETLQFFYKKIAIGTSKKATKAAKSWKGNSIVVYYDWDLENFMAQISEADRRPSLHGRLNSDDDTEIEKKDTLLTFFAAGASDTFMSSDRGLANTAASAGVKKSNFKRRAYVNMTEGGTWKWRSKGSGSTPVDPTKPTDAPTSTSTPKPTARPIKDPSGRPTEGPGTGPTNPESSTDPQTTAAPPTSTAAPAVTEAPAPTAAPTEVPTAVVRPTEQCEQPVATPIREDTNPTPAPEEHHEVPTQEPATSHDGDGTTDFNPDSI